MSSKNRTEVSKLPIIPPLIPSLPSGDGGMNKENFAEKSLSAKKASPAIQRRSCAVPCDFSNNTMLTSPSPNGVYSKRMSSRVTSASKEIQKTTPLTGSKSSTVDSGLSRHRVLRYRETVESLFCLSPETSEECRGLCQQIVDGPLANDAAAWIKVLKAASANIGNGIKGSDLVKLHRRASTRFSNLDDEGAIATDRLTLEIWLRYAACQSRYSTFEDSRCTFRHIMRKGLGSKLARLYLEFATFEASLNEIDRALDILKLGIDNNAQPLVNLEVMYRKLQQRSTDSKRRGSKDRINLLSLSRKRINNKRDETSPKRSKVLVNLEPRVNKRDDTANSNMSLDTNSDGEKEDVIGTTTVQPLSQSRKQSGRIDQEHELSTHESLRSQPLPDNLPSTAVRRGNSNKTPLSNFRKPLLSNPGFLNLGKAQRVDRGEETAELESDDELREHVSVRKNRQSPKCAPKLKKADLSYMLNWDPEKFRSKKSVEKKDSGSDEAVVPVLRSNTDGAESSIVPVTQKVTQPDISMNTATTNGTGGSHDSNKSDESVKAAVERDSLTARQVTATSSTSNQKQDPKTDTLPLTGAILAHANMDFLPLIYEKNMLRVNGIPYTKLGMIGKGGSCKVYRALSKECSVVAVKKVKLQGIDKKGIEGYANEIALLKRLRGNPAIIQMHDSEVDLDRKLILIVMELGEVDLNVVLQDQARQALITGKPDFNANFVRLTWEQMLKAVHCIHEERIIHGDLKPANFLFVRGTLKLIDFGIAKAIQGDETNHIYRDSQIGTLNYMSPESIVGADSGGNSSGMGPVQWKMGRPSDVWSLGCILYQMVYGRTPFAELKSHQKLYAIVSPNHEISYPEHADEAAIDCMRRILQRDPAKRPTIVGDDGLLQHQFLNPFRRKT